MTNEEIERYFEKLKAAQNAHGQDFQAQANELYLLQEEIGLNLPHTLEDTMQKKVFNMSCGLHTFLQTNMMLNACTSSEESGKLAEESCKSAKWSCFWAAIAAIAACASIVVMFFLR